MSTWKEMARLIGMPDEVIDSRKANNRANVLKSPCYTLAWAVVLQLFHVTYSAELLDLAGALQNDIVELGVLVLKLLMDPRLATRPAVDSDGFKVLRLDVLITADEPAPSLRKPILAALKKIKAGSGKRYCDLVDIIGERAYSILIGKVCNPGPTNNGDAALGFIVPACFVGKSNGVQVKQKDWNDADVEATMKRASELWAAAWGVGGKPIAGADLGDTNIQNAGVMYLHGVCDYEGYHYAKCICAYPSFAALMMKLYSSEPTATVTMANLKGTGRYNAKLNQYTHEGKSQPASQFVKDVIRCLVQTAGHQEMQHAAGLLEKKCNVRSRKNRVTSPTHDLLYVIDLGKGVLAEVQFGFKSVVAIKSLGHQGYKFMRVDTDEGDLATFDALFEGDFLNPPSILDATGGFDADYANVNPADLKLVNML